MTKVIKLIGKTVERQGNARIWYTDKDLDFTSDKPLMENFIFDTPHHDINRSEVACWQYCDNVSCTDSSTFTSWLAFWCKAMIRRIFLRYLYSPVYLILLPLILGILIGYWLGRRKQTSISQEFNQHNKRKSKSIHFLVPITHQLLETKEKMLSWAVHFVLILNSSFRLFSRRCHNDAQKAEQIMNTKEAKFSQSEKPRTFTDADDDLKMKEEAARQSKYKRDSHFEAGVVKENIPQHIAVIMDGNRRYGRAKYGMASKVSWCTWKPFSNKIKFNL